MTANCPPRSLKAQLSTMLAVVALPLLAALAYFMSEEYRDRREDAEQTARLLAKAAAIQAERFLDDSERMLAALSRRESVRALDAARCPAVFRDFLDLHAEYLNLVSVSAEGWVVCSALPLKERPLRLEPIRPVENLREARTFIVGTPDKSVISGKPILPLAYPIVTDGRQAGFIGVGVDLANFKPVAPALPEGLNPRVALIDARGALLADSGGGADRIGHASDDAVTRWAISGASGVTDEIAWDGVERIVAVQAIPGTSWRVLAGIEARAAVEPVVTGIRRAVLFVLGLMALGILLGLLLKRRIEGATRGLANVSRAAASGNLGARAAPTGIAEFDEIGSQINAMLETIEADRGALAASRETLLRVFEGSPVPIVITRIDTGAIVHVNPAFERATGFDPAEILGRSTLDVGVVRDAAARRRFIERLTRLGAVYNEPVWAVCKDGTRRHFLVSARLVELDGVPHSVAILHDTTQARQAEKDLRSSEARFQALARLSADWYWEQDAAYRFVANTEGLRDDAVQFLPGVIGKTRWELPAWGVDEAQWEAHRTQLMRREPFRNFEYQMMGRDGLMHWVAVSGEPIVDEGGAFRGYRGVGRDVTERRRLLDLAAIGHHALELSARGRPLPEILEAIARSAERQSPQQMCSILLVDAEGARLRVCAAPGLPAAYNRAIDGVAIGPEAGACGSAAYLGREVVASDIDTDPRWVGYRDLARAHGLRACWSIPIRGAAGQVLGTFAAYFRVPREPRADERDVLSALADLAATVIGRSRVEGELVKLSRAVEQSPVSIVITDTSGRIEYVNAAFCATTGYAREEAVGRNPRILKSGETPDEEYARLWQAITSGREWFGELHNRRKDGSLYWESAHIMPVSSGGGETLHFLAVKEDITRRKATEMALKASERRYRLLAESAQDGILTYALDGFAVEYANPAALAMFGASSLEELSAGGSLLDRVHADFRDTMLRRRDILARRDRVPLVEVKFLRLDGSAFDVDVQGTAAEIDGRRRVQMMIRDISGRRELEKRDSARQAQLLHSARLASMGEMASSLAHELNQPLTAISNFSGAGLRRLEQGIGPQEMRDILEMVGAQARRAGEIIWRMRDFARPAEAELVPLDINAAALDIAHLAEVQARAPGVVVEFHLADDLPPVRADRVQVEQVLLNLIKNGIEAMAGPGWGKRLSVATRRLNADEIEVVVADEGCGLPPTHAVDAFPAFVTTKPDGLGLGLTISRSIVEAHGGRLWSRAGAPMGTAFHFTLQIDRKEETAHD